ncbi:hypothetical protein PTKIN_Ptkin04bG0224500 [Pterospermum kingtungense]
MDPTFLALKIISVLLATYVFLFGFLKKVNEWYYVSRLGNKNHSLPPGDLGWPLLGNMWSFITAFPSENPEAFIDNLIKRCGRTSIYKTQLYGNPSIIVCSPETCRKVLLDDDKFGSGYPKGTVELLGKRSLPALPTPEYKRLRKLITAPIGSPEALSMYVRYIEDCVMISLEEWANMNRPIEFLTEIKTVFFKILANIFLGSSAETLPVSARKYYGHIHDGLISMAINIPGFSFYKALRARKMLVKIFQSVVDERKAMNKKMGDDNRTEKKGMIDLFMEVEDEKGQKLKDEERVNLLLLFLVAGHESSASAVNWATIFLHNNPETLKKAKEGQEEILKRRPSGQKGLSLKEMRQMEYLSKVIDETLRMVNLLFANFRWQKVDANINGYFIPKGWKVLVWNREVHMDPENYENPKQFLPSRWDNDKTKPGAFIPFGGGIRICPGSELAKLQISIFFHYFLLNYRLEQINPGRRVVYLPGPRPTDHCLARVIKLP